MNVNLRILILFLTTLFFISTSGYARPPLEGSKLKYLSSWKKPPYRGTVSTNGQND